MLTTVTMTACTFALTALALGLGALFPNYETENAAEIPTSFGGLVFMMVAVGYLGAVVVLEAWPVYLFLAAGVADAPVSGGGIRPLVLGVTGAGLLTLLAIVLPLRAGVRRVRTVDF